MLPSSEALPLILSFVFYRWKTKELTSRIARPPDWHTFHKVWLKLDKICATSCLLKIEKSKFCEVHRMTPKLTHEREKSPYVWSSYG